MPPDGSKDVLALERLLLQLPRHQHRAGLRGHHWDCILEMSAAMFVEAGVLVAASWAGAVSGSTLVAWQHALMMPVMVVVMLFRLDLYTGRVSHSGHAE